jgi:hypothetical protein
MLGAPEIGDYLFGIELEKLDLGQKPEGVFAHCLTLLAL